VIILTLLYATYVVLVAYLSPIDCLDEPCNSEGLDNSILGWATDYFIAIFLIGFGVHLWWNSPRGGFCRCCSNDSIAASTSSSFPAVLSLWLMGVAYILGGLGHSVFTNSGLDDNAGQQGFYITWAISFTLMTLSVEETYRFVHSVMSATRLSSSCCCCRRLQLFLNISLGLVVGAWVATTGGYVWCATNKDLHVSGQIDTVPPLGGDDLPEQCLQVAATAEVTWYVCFSIFWLPTGFILRSVVIEKEKLQQERLRVCQFPVAWAAIWVSIIPWTFGIMLIVYSGMAAIAVGLEGTQIYEDIYGAVIYHYGMLLGYFLFHNMAYALTLGDDDINISRATNGRENGKRPSNSSNEMSC
jgi:hypothetical protein